MTRPAKAAANRDVLIIGAGLSGLVAADVLSHLGLSCLVLEKAPQPGGGCRSIDDGHGNLFDCGFHAIDDGRSRLTTRFVQKALKGRCVRFELNRGIVLRDHLFDYNAPLEDWPAELQALFKAPPREDDIAGALTRDKVARVYGKAFTDFAFDEVLLSYPSKKWALAHGAKEEDHFENIYPWFFPRAKRKTQRQAEWHTYHDKMRQEPKHYMLYPKSGAFGGLVTALIQDFSPGLVEIRAGCKDLSLELGADGKTVTAVKAGGERHAAELILWCTAPQAFLGAMGQKPMAGQLQTIVLGNFAFKGPTNCPHHEVIVGSLQHKINRLAFPGKLSGGKDNLVQVEFYFPAGEFPGDAESWKADWLKSLRRLGVVSENNALESFHFITEPKGVATTERFDALTETLRARIEALGSNVRIPYYNLGPENASRVIAGTITGVGDILKTTLK